MQSLVSTYPNRYSLRGMEFLSTRDVNDITIFIRPASERAMSALMQQMQLYGITSDQMRSMMDNSQNIPLLDSHIIPQFWYLLSLTANHRDLKMNFFPISELHRVDATIPVLNARSGRNQLLELSPTVTHRIEYLFTEDVVLYNNIVNRTATIGEIITKIKLETNFVADLRSYARHLTYLL